MSKAFVLGVNPLLGAHAFFAELPQILHDQSTVSQTITCYFLIFSKDIPYVPSTRWPIRAVLGLCQCGCQHPERRFLR